MSDFPTSKQNHLCQPVVGGCPVLARQHYDAVAAPPAKGTSAEEVEAVAKERGWIK